LATFNETILTSRSVSIFNEFILLNYYRYQLVF
jgi:hypothetical protein